MTVPVNETSRLITMPQSLGKLYVHLVFSTKNRQPSLSDFVRGQLHMYINETMLQSHCPVIRINSVEDHIHILFTLARTVSTSWIVEEVKRSSSKWLKTQSDELIGFQWQRGYAAFTVSSTDVDGVSQYISQQREHHARKSFCDEYRHLLDLNNVEYDERYMWD